MALQRIEKKETHSDRYTCLPLCLLLLELPKQIYPLATVLGSRAAAEKVVMRLSLCVPATYVIDTRHEPSVVSRWSIGNGLFTPSLTSVHTSDLASTQLTDHASAHQSRAPGRPHRATRACSTT